MRINFRTKRRTALHGSMPPKELVSLNVRQITVFFVSFFGVATVSCGPQQFGGGRDGGRDGMMVDCPHPPPDTDGDGISDRDEGAPTTDTDHDGKPDYRDL